MTVSELLEALQKLPLSSQVQIRIKDRLVTPVLSVVFQKNIGKSFVQGDTSKQDALEALNY